MSFARHARVFRPQLFAAMIMTKDQQASSVPTDSGVWLHDPDGGAWQRLGPEIQLINGATAAPSEPDVIYLAAGNGVVRSRDGGVSWRLVSGWQESDVLEIAVDPANPDVLYAATAWGIVASRNGGESWRPADHGLEERFTKTLVMDVREPNRLLAGTTKGLFVSTDGAESWRRCASIPSKAILRLRQGLQNPSIWIAGTEGAGLWLSRDNGQQWSQVCPALREANLYAVAVDPQDSDRLVAGGWGSGVHCSRDGGCSWTPVGAGLPSSHITALAFDPGQSARIWASTFEEGTFHSDDFGRSWHSAHLEGAYVSVLGFLHRPRSGRAAR